MQRIDIAPIRGTDLKAPHPVRRHRLGPGHGRPSLVVAKDAEGAAIFYEPLAAWDPDGNLVAVLAAEIPNTENGGVAADGISVTWKLKRGVQWHDGEPFTADDVVFNWEYASDPATAATTIGSYQDVEVEKIDTFAVRVRFQRPTPFWAGRANGLIIPKHLFEPFKGANSRSCQTLPRDVARSLPQM